MILLIDNYDSFVHNLARQFRLLGCETLVLRNDAVSVADVRAMAPRAVVLSPGPCSPAEAGVSLALVRELHAELPMLGICLGHQAIVAALGGVVSRATHPMHGRSSLVTHDGLREFAGLPNPLRCGRYHSLVVEAESLPPELIATAWTEEGVNMAVRHRELPVVGLQFHPESVLTDHGLRQLKNFIDVAVPRAADHALGGV